MAQITASQCCRPADSHIYPGLILNGDVLIATNRKLGIRFHILKKCNCRRSIGSNRCHRLLYGLIIRIFNSCRPFLCHSLINGLPGLRSIYRSSIQCDPECPGCDPCAVIIARNSGKCPGFKITGQITELILGRIFFDCLSCPISNCIQMFIYLVRGLRRLTAINLEFKSNLPV